MVEEEIGIDSSDERPDKDQVRKHMANCETHLASTDIPVDATKAFKLPIDQLSALGVGFGSLPEMFRTITTTVDVPTLLQATDKAGKPISPETLQKFSDGSGLMGSMKDAATGFKQVRFHPVEGSAIQSVSTLPYDPTLLFAAAAIAQINQKLDAIQDTVNELFEYLRQKDKAELRGNIRVLEGILEDYPNNWNNDVWLKNAHMKAFDIKQESEQVIIHLRAQIKESLNKKGLIEVRHNVNDRLDKVLDRLKEYQLATYAFSFAGFLEPLLCGNFDEANLLGIIGKIRDRGNEYRELYTTCYNAIEKGAKGAADTATLGGVATALLGLGSLVGRTPLGDKTPIDEALQGAGEKIGGFNERQTSELMNKLQHAKTPNILPFREALESVNTLSNQPYQLALDKENIYLLPE